MFESSAMQAAVIVRLLLSRSWWCVGHDVSVHPLLLGIWVGALGRWYCCGWTVPTCSHHGLDVLGELTLSVHVITNCS